MYGEVKVQGKFHTCSLYFHTQNAHTKYTKISTIWTFPEIKLYNPKQSNKAAVLVHVHVVVTCTCTSRFNGTCLLYSPLNADTCWQSVTVSHSNIHIHVCVLSHSFLLTHQSWWFTQLAKLDASHTVHIHPVHAGWGLAACFYHPASSDRFSVPYYWSKSFCH